MTPQQAGRRAGDRRRRKRLHMLEVMADRLRERGVKMMHIPREDWLFIRALLTRA